ncbi:Transthyretin-like family protein [Ancylostoma duodenale]|uniref:Transthyretin-like family protein n=1 Tax=Ancylostoma duodenale TaxID=51022 RepID=A0A0C2GKS7_9BILA|nr:Transthyretin-like family protein [Ancylostoma duodenale]
MVIQAILCASLFSLCAAFREQSIAVKGRLLCGTEPASNIRVKLWDEDSGYSDSNGEFFLAGATKEFTAMEPILKIYHDCNDGIKSGVRKLKFGLPDQYISNGLTPLKTVDVGVINLELTYMEEGRKSIAD